MTINELVGIPWVLNGRDFKGTDCVGIFYIYLNCFKGLKDEFTDFLKDYRMRKYRKPDGDFLKKVLDNFGKRIEKDKILSGDILIFKIENEIHAGLLFGFKKFLHSIEPSGSCLEPLEGDYSKILEYGVRLNV